MLAVPRYVPAPPTYIDNQKLIPDDATAGWAPAPLQGLGRRAQRNLTPFHRLLNLEISRNLLGYYNDHK